MAATAPQMLTVDAAFTQAMAHCQAGRMHEGEVLLRAVLQQQPDHAYANHNLGMIAMRMGHPQPAQPLFERALALMPQYAQFWLSLAECRYLQGDWEAVTAVVDQAQAQGIAHPQFARLRSAMLGDDAPAGARRKVFCIGRNKTGTTSLEAALASLGYRMGLQARGEMLSKDWARRDFTRLLQLCRTADAFQDAPFSRAHTYRAVDTGFPGSKFILTVRNSAQEWYESVVSFNTKIVNKGRVPTAEDLKAFDYRYKGYLWEAARGNYGIDETTLYDRDIYTAHYLEHNAQVAEYFRDRPSDLLVLNVSAPDAMRTLCAFLGIAYTGQPMPHMNKSR